MTFVDEVNEKFKNILDWVLVLFEMIIDMLKLIIEMVDMGAEASDLIVLVIPVFLCIYVFVEVFKSLFF